MAELAAHHPIRILDVTQDVPSLSTELYSNEYILAGQQVIFNGGQDVWVYDEHGLAKLPTLSMEEKIQDGIEAYKKRDYAKALRFLWPLRNQKNYEAPYYLGMIYLHGHGLTKDYLQARSYFQAAAGMGNTRALFQLANMYADGFAGSPPNAKQARELYLEGANLGDGTCQLALGVQLATGIGGSVELSVRPKTS